MLTDSGYSGQLKTSGPSGPMEYGRGGYGTTGVSSNPLMQQNGGGIPSWMQQQMQAQNNASFADLKTGGLNALNNYNFIGEQQGLLNQGLPLDLADINQAMKDNSEILGYRDQILANLQSLYGINDQDLANQLAQSWMNQQVQESILGTQGQQNELDALQKKQGLFSQGVAQGSALMPGQEVGQRQIRTSADQVNAMIDQQLRKAREGGQFERTGAQLDFDKGKVGLGNEILNQRIARANAANANNQAKNAAARTKLSYAQKQADLRQQGYNAILPLQKMMNSGNPQLMEMAQKMADSLGLMGQLYGE